MTVTRSVRRAAVVGILLVSPLVAVAQPAHAGTAPYGNASLPIPQRVADLVGRMTLAEKVGQMTQAERASIDSDPSIIASDNLGSVLSGAGSDPTPNTPVAWADMVDRYQRAALNRACTSRCCTESTRCTATATCTAPLSSRTTSA